MAKHATVTVILAADVGPLMKSLKDGAAAINALYEAYLATMPWYRRWPIRLRVWVKVRWTRFDNWFYRNWR